MLENNNTVYYFCNGREGYQREMPSLQRLKSSVLKLCTCQCTLRQCSAIVAASLALLMFIYYCFGDKDYKFYRNYKACTEEVYNFPEADASILSDALLWSKCDKTADIERSRKSRILKREYKITGQVPIFTKCGAVNGVLVSKVTSTLEPKLAKRYDNIDKKYYPVPNIVHYISFGMWEFQFLNYLSFVSAHKFIKPWAIYVHGDSLPTGKWWNRTLHQVPNVFHVMRKRTKRIQGKVVGWLEHSTDVLRLQTILDNGGIYLDTDVIVLKSFDPLRKHALTLGRETSYGLGSSIVIGQPGSAFVCIWRASFREYAPYPWNWARYAVWTPHALAKHLPEHINIEVTSLQSPTWAQSDLLFNKLYDWSNNYATHIWKRFGEVPDNPSDIKLLNTTLGEVMRYVYFGSKDLISNDTQNRVISKNHLYRNLKTTIDLMGDKLLTLIGFNN